MEQKERDRKVRLTKNADNIPFLKTATRTKPVGTVRGIADMGSIPTIADNDALVGTGSAGSRKR